MITGNVLDQLNNSHKQIQFTYEVEQNNKLPLLDVLLIKNANNEDTTVYRKPTYTNIYLNWNQHVPTTSKTVYSNERYLHEEMKYIESTFKRFNNYPENITNQPNREVKLKHTENMNIERSTITQTALNDQEKHHLLVLPYAGNKGETILKSINKFSSRVLPCNVKTCIIYSRTKLSSRFQLKDQTKKDHWHDVVY